jgi:hypothetical protein
MRDLGISRRHLLKGFLLTPWLANIRNFSWQDDKMSPFSKRLQPIGRIYGARARYMLRMGRYMSSFHGGLLSGVWVAGLTAVK